MGPRMSTVCAIAVAVLMTGPVAAVEPFHFSTGDPDGKIATASRPESSGKIEIESADDFILNDLTSIQQATFVGLLPADGSRGLVSGNTILSSIAQVRVEIYRVFPNDSTNPPSGNVPTRTNSPSDVALLDRSSSAGTLTFTATVIDSEFTAANSVLNGIHKIPNQTTGGEGPVTGEEVLFTVGFNPPITLPPDHYFFIPQVELSGAGNFFWLSAPKPIVAPGTPFSPDLQSWIRNADLDPDWLRIGTDIVGGSPAPTFNGTFSLSGVIGVAQAPALGGVALVALTALLASVGLLTLRGRRPGQRGFRIGV